MDSTGREDRRQILEFVHLVSMEKFSGSPYCPRHCSVLMT